MALVSKTDSITTLPDEPLAVRMRYRRIKYSFSAKQKLILI